MLTIKQIKEIREELEGSANPLFYFDNDQDGLVSFLLFRRFLKKGVGIPVKNSPLDEGYFRRVKEFEPDKIFILDQPEISEGFSNKLLEYGVPVIWIDHHDIEFSKIPDFIRYYNPVKDKKENIPTCILAYSVVKNKKDSWLGILGSISDHFIPSFYPEFLKEYPDLGIKSKDAFEIYYNSEIGRLSRFLGAGLKDRTSLVFKMIRLLYSISSPYELLEETKENNFLHKRFEKLEQKFNSLIEKAKKQAGNKKILFFKYSGDTSMSADISNKLSYLYSEKIIIVAFVNGGRVNVSLRGESIRKIFLEVIKNFEGARGGGHENAIGCQLNLEDLENFVRRIEELFS